MADWLGMCERLPGRVRRGVDDDLLVGREQDRVADDRREGGHLPAPGSDDAREPLQGL